MIEISTSRALRCASAIRTMSSDSSAPPLDARFARAVAKLQTVDETWASLSYLARTPPPPPRTSPQSPTAAAEAVSALNQLSAAVSQAALLSSNEALDEIPTSSLKYLLLPYLQARAQAQVQGDPHERHAALLESKRYLSAFFDRADRLRMLSERERDAALEETPVRAATPSERRDAKIARFKAEKEAEKQLAVLREKASVAAPDDDEAERELALTVLKGAVRRALDMLDATEQELEVLRFAVRQIEKGVDPREKAERARPRGPPPGLGGLPPTFRIVNEREKEKEGVFRPSHSLPTYTVEEWGQFEMERAIKAENEKKEKEVFEARRKEEEDSDGDEAVDRETMEKRRWDDWADEHNKGSGNTIR